METIPTWVVIPLVVVAWITGQSVGEAKENMRLRSMTDEARQILKELGALTAQLKEELKRRKEK